jgi:hypothetical protein
MVSFRPQLLKANGNALYHLPKVSAEMSLHVLAYNLKRVMRIMGTGALVEALRA